MTVAELLDKHWGDIGFVVSITLMFWWMKS